MNPKLLKLKMYLLRLDSCLLNYVRFQSLKQAWQSFLLFWKQLIEIQGKYAICFPPHPLLLFSSFIRVRQSKISFIPLAHRTSKGVFMFDNEAQCVALTRSLRTPVVSVHVAGWTWQPGEQRQDHLSRVSSLPHVHEFCKCKPCSNGNKKKKTRWKKRLYKS